MVIILLAVLAAIAIPNFQDVRKEAKNETLKAQLGAIRTSIAIARATIAMKEDGVVPIYPTYNEISSNSFNGSHPILNALPAEKKRIFTPDHGTGPWPKNVWSLSTTLPSLQNGVSNCANYNFCPNWGTCSGSFSRPYIASYYLFPNWGNWVGLHSGWCYDERTGDFWANSALNGDPVGSTENNF